MWKAFHIQTTLPERVGIGTLFVLCVVLVGTSPRFIQLANCALTTLSSTLTKTTTTNAITSCQTSMSTIQQVPCLQCCFSVHKGAEIQKKAWRFVWSCRRHIVTATNVSCNIQLLRRQPRWQPGSGVWRLRRRFCVSQRLIHSKSQPQLRFDTASWNVYQRVLSNTEHDEPDNKNVSASCRKNP